MIKQLLNRKVLIAALVIAALLLGGSVLYILLARPADTQPGSGPIGAALTVIPAPTGTSRPLPPTLTSLPPTSTLRPTPGLGEFGLGAYVQVHSTGVEGLNIRSAPGLTAYVIFSGFDAEVFLITDGPQSADGFTWWRLTATYDSERQGWAAEDFLEVMSSP